MLAMDLGSRILLAAVIASIGLVVGQDRDYRLLLRTADIGRLDRDYVDNSSYLVAIYYDDQPEVEPVVHGKVIFKQDLPPETEVWWEVYTVDNDNVLSLMAKGPKTKLCNFVKDQKQMADMVIKYSDLPPECPYTKGEYHIKDALVDNEVFPVKIPKDQQQYRLYMNFANNSRNIFKFWVHCLVKWSE